jgi:DHA1 family tetracycline resistance protein-like MFS transporter
MIYAWLPVFGVAFLTYPSLQSTMSRQVGPDAQGELQGAVAAIYGLSTIVTPLIATQQFAYFSGPHAPVDFPGAPFALAATAALLALAIFAATVRGPAVAAQANRAS